MAKYGIIYIIKNELHPADIYNTSEPMKSPS